MSLRDPFEIAQSLFGIAAMAAHMLDEAEPEGEGEWQALPPVPEARPPFVAPAGRAIAELEQALADANWYPSDESLQANAGERWTFGTARILRAPIRTIKGGFVEPVLRVPLVQNVPEPVVLYLITLDGGRDYLEREMHDVMGWHYHYLDDKKRRSDVLLAWDTRWSEQPTPTMPLPRRGLFAEKHGEGRAKFTACPSRWRDRKRKTIYLACAPDLAKWPITTFRCASDKSEIVYPPGFVLTARS